MAYKQCLSPIVAYSSIGLKYLTGTVNICHSSVHLYGTRAAEGLWAGNRKRKDSIIENTTVHSHSSTAGTVHSYRPTITMWVEGWVSQGLPTYISQPKAVEPLHFQAHMKRGESNTLRHDQRQTPVWKKGKKHCVGFMARGDKSNTFEKKKCN